MDIFDGVQGSSAQLILFANGRMCFPFTVGGDGHLVHNLMSGLGRSGYSALHLGPLQPVDWPISISEIDNTLRDKGIQAKWHWNQAGQGKIPSERSVIYNSHQYTCWMLDADAFWRELSHICQQLRPKLVMTQLDCAQEVISICKEFKVPVILWVVDVDNENEALLSREPLADAVIFDSQFLKTRYEKLCRIRNFVVHPILDFSGLAPQAKSGECISMVNPITEKGGEIFFEIARRMKNVNFLVLEGWKNVKHENHPSNITVLGRASKIEELYKRTKILLVPSIIEDAFPTVIPLAQACGIPVVGSNLGGIPEAIGENGLIVEDPYNIESWVKAINRLLLNPDLYKSISEATRKGALDYTPDKLMARVKQIISELPQSTAA
jgi:glycosyltransferase involved in cell wall biosynthesis